MKIQISQDDRGHTSLKVDGVELGNHVTKFSLSQIAGEVPVLNLQLFPLNGIDVELPDGVVIVKSKDSPHTVSRSGCKHWYSAVIRNFKNNFRKRG